MGGMKGKFEHGDMVNAGTSDDVEAGEMGDETQRLF